MIESTMKQHVVSLSREAIDKIFEVLKPIESQEQLVKEFLNVPIISPAEYRAGKLENAAAVCRSGHEYGILRIQRDYGLDARKRPVQCEWKPLVHGLTLDEVWEAVKDFRVIVRKDSTKILEALFTHVFPQWSWIERLDGYPKCSKATSSYIARKFMDFDSLWTGGGVMPGGIWLNYGFSSCEVEGLADWKVVPCGFTTLDGASIPAAAWEPGWKKEEQFA